MTTVVSAPNNEVTPQTSYISRWIAQSHGNFQQRKSSELYSSDYRKSHSPSQITTTWQAQAKTRLHSASNSSAPSETSTPETNEFQDKLQRVRALLDAKKQRLCRHLSSTSTSSSMTSPLQDQVPDSTVVGDHCPSPPPPPPSSSSSLVLENIYHSHDDPLSSSNSPYLYHRHSSSPSILPCLVEESPSDSGLSDGTKTTHPDEIQESMMKNSAIIDLSKPLTKEEMLAAMQILRELWRKQFDCEMPEVELKSSIPTTSFKRIGETKNLSNKNKTQYHSTPVLNKLNAELNDIKDKLTRFSNERVQGPSSKEEKGLELDEPVFVSFSTPSSTDNLERIQTKKDILLRHQIQRREEQLSKKSERQTEAAERQDEYRLFEEYLSQRRQEAEQHRSTLLQVHLEQKRFEADPLSSNDYYFATAQNRQRLKRKASLSSFLSCGDDELSHTGSLNIFQTPKRSVTRFDLISPSLTAPTAASRSKMNRAVSSCHLPGHYDSSTSLNSKATVPTSLFGGSLMNLSKAQAAKRKSTSLMDEIFDSSQFSASMTSLATSMAGSRLARSQTLLSTKSNKQTIINSLKQVALAGPANERQRDVIIREVEASEARHFVLLFRDHRLQFRAVYMYIPETDIIEKLHGIGPNLITEVMVDKWFKYNSGGKRFTSIPIRHFSIQCDAVLIHNDFWQKKTIVNKPH